MSRNIIILDIKCQDLKKDIKMLVLDNEVFDWGLDKESINRAKKMIHQMEVEGFGSCSNHRHCEVVCPQEISVSNITLMNSLL